MKLFFILALVLPFSLAAKVIPTYSVSYLKDPSVSASQTKVVIHCDQFSTAAEDDAMHYGANEFGGTLPAVVEQPLDVVLPAGKYAFAFFYSSQYEEIEADSIEVKPGVVTRITLHFFLAHEPVRLKKPVIYLYPETDTEVEVTVGTEKGLSFAYPAYNAGWKGTAHPDGSMTINGKTYPYLFWEADKTLTTDLMSQQTGFVIDREQVVAFLEEKLTAMGLNATEQTDFITFWGPQMVQHKQVFLRFAWNEAIDPLATLTISPQPRINRLYVIWSEELPVTMPEAQNLPVFDRSGFDALEWGGVEIPAFLTETAEYNSTR